MNTLKITNSTGVFSLQNSFVDKFLKDANPSFIKVYIYIARHASQGGEITLAKIAEDTGLLQSDVVTALTFWDKSGAISYKESDISILPVSDYTQLPNDTYTPQPTQKNMQSSESVASSYRSTNVIKTVNSNEKLANLFTIISQLINKSLSPNDYKIIYSFIDYLKLPEQVILVLFEYCVSIAKTNMRYIEKIAYSWADNGIVTPELALEYVRKQNDKQSVISVYKKNFKISGRDFSDTEEKYLLTWINEYRASEELIMKAYDTAVMNTGKVSFKYMDAIIKNELSNKGAKSGDTLSPNIKNSGFRNYPQDNTLSDIEKKMIEKMMAQFGGDGDAVNK